MQGETIKISWESEGIHLIRLDFSADNGLHWVPLFESVAATDQQVIWEGPDSPTENALIRLLSVDPEGASGVMGGTFRIEEPALAFVLDTDDLILNPGESFQIVWEQNTGALDPLFIEFSSDGGMTWASISEPLVGQTAWGWEVPDVQSEECLLRIRSETNPLINGVSGSFSIREHARISLAEHPELSETDGVVVFLKKAPYPLDRFAVYAQGDNLYQAFLLVCPHAGCTPDYSEGSKEFVCPCHGSTFTDRGCFVFGPANGSLPGLLVSLSVDQQVLRVFPEVQENDLCG